MVQGLSSAWASNTRPKQTDLYQTARISGHQLNVSAVFLDGGTDQGKQLRNTLGKAGSVSGHRLAEGRRRFRRKVLLESPLRIPRGLVVVRSSHEAPMIRFSARGVQPERNLM